MARPPRVGDGAPVPERAVRLLALDLDGTALDPEQRLHPRSRDAVRSAVAGGLVVVLATGRMYRSTLPWARELHVTAPLLCYQGAVVRAVPDTGDGPGQLLFEDPMEPRPALTALRAARRGGWHRQGYLDDQLLCEEDRPEGRLYAGIAQVPITFVDDLEPLMSARGSTKVVCVVDDSDGAARCETAMREALAGSARVTRSLPPFVEITNPLAGKGRALIRVCERLGVAMDEVVAVGDAPNDIDMLAASGYAIAVEGARDDVIAAADAVCPPPQEAGVAALLSWLGVTA